MHSLEAAASAQEPLHTLPCGALCMLFMMRGTSSSRALLCIALLCSPCRAANQKTLFSPAWYVSGSGACMGFECVAAV